MKRKLIVVSAQLSLLLLLVSLAEAQETPLPYSKNACYIEGFGPGGWASLNYERFLFTLPRSQAAFRVGFSTYKTKDYTDSYNPDLIFPLSLNLLFGSTHRLEAGIGQTITSTVESNESDGTPRRELRFHASSTIGYRYMHPQGGILFRAGYTPVLEQNRRFRHWAALSVGYAF